MIMITFEAYFFLDNEGMILWSLLYSKFLANLLYFWMTRLPALIWRTGGAKWWSYLEDLLRDHRNGCWRIFVLRIWGKLDSDMNSFLKDGWAVSIFENEGLSFITSSNSCCEKPNVCSLLSMSPWLSYSVTWKRILNKLNRVRQRVSSLINRYGISLLYQFHFMESSTFFDALLRHDIDIHFPYDKY